MEKMQSIIEDAFRYSEIEQERDTISSFKDVGTPRIAIVGCGGAGNNTIKRLCSIGVVGAETIAVNTDKQHLELIPNNGCKKILIGRSLTKGLGAGGFPHIGRQAAELDRMLLEDALKDTDLVFITAGMGGGTGTGSAPVVAEVAKDEGAIVVGMVSFPFKIERTRRVLAEQGIEELRRAADTVVILDNNRLLNYVPNVPIDQAFSVMDQLISETVKGISETITLPSLINLDYADVKSIMHCGGVAVMLVGEAQSQDKSHSVVKAVLNHPLLDVDYRSATGALIHITGGPDLTLREAEEIAATLTKEIDPKANLIWGSRVDENYAGKVKVMAIMTGVRSAQVLGPSVGIGTRELAYGPVIDVIR
ncbi:MAG: cell division protein FtsZ [Methanocellales archaeon]|nr:cell division protein FtsZ [Methanocellales archaeon]